MPVTVKSGRLATPIRLLIYGPEGVGKTTFATDFPDSIDIDIDVGSEELDVKRYEPKVTSYEELVTATKKLTNEDHPHKTVIFDTATKIEEFIFKYVNHRDPSDVKESIVDHGYGKGYDMALDVWREFLVLLDTMIEKRSLNVIFIGHAIVKTFKNPEGEDYDRYNIAMQDKAAGLLKQWCKAVGFARYETIVTKSKDATKKAKGQDTGARFLHFSRTAAYDAKTRYRIPNRIPLSYQAFADAMQSGRSGDPDQLFQELMGLIPQLGTHGMQAQADEITTRAKQIRNDAFKLSKAIDYTTGLLQPFNSSKEEMTP